MKPRGSNLQTSANSQAQALSGQSSIPDGGLTAWLQVLGANFLFFNSWFVRRVEELLCINTITHMQGHREYVRSLPGVLRKLSDRQLVIRNFVDRNFPRLPSDHFWHHWWSNFRPWILSCLLATGIFLVVFGMMMTSLATTYWQIFLAQGLCVGLGASCLFLPSVAIVATYFSTKRALAIGISAAGGSIGSVIYSIIFHRLQSKVGASWATRVIGFITLCTLSISMMVMKTAFLRQRPNASSQPLRSHRVSFYLLCALQCGAFSYLHRSLYPIFLRCYLRPA
jgi:MFS family permease